MDKFCFQFVKRKKTEHEIGNQNRRVDSESSPRVNEPQDWGDGPVLIKEELLEDCEASPTDVFRSEVETPPYIKEEIEWSEPEDSDVPSEQEKERSEPIDADVQDDGYRERFESFLFNIEENNCESCSVSYLEAITKFYNKDEESLEFFRKHGVIVRNVKCRTCSSVCSISRDGKSFYCHRKRKDPKTKEVLKCSFTQSIFKKSWLEDTEIKPWVNLLFINIFNRRHFSPLYCQSELNLDAEAMAFWNALCVKVCEHYVSMQSPIGGPGIIVEADKNKFGRSNRSWQSTGIWVFGCVERISKNKVVVPVEDISDSTLLTCVHKFIRPGSIIVSDQWGSSSTLSELGYEHRIVDQSVNAYTGMHFQSIEKVWRGIKEWAPRATNQKENYFECFARHLFAHSVPSDERLHHFLRWVASLYPPAR